MTTPAASSFAAELRESTSELHTIAEKSALQKLLVTGRVSQEQYVAHLGQMLILHRELDNALRQAVKVSPAVALLVKDEQYQEPYLLEDLQYFGVDPASITPLASTSKIIADIRRVEQEDPAALLGYHYVLEGANNGNRFIAKALAGTFRVRPGAPGTRYLDPYGERQRALWTTFKTNLDVIELSPATRAHAMECAKAMFLAVAHIGDEIMDKLGGSVVVMPQGPAVTVGHN